MRTEPLAQQPVIVIAGPTASGKSSLSLELADFLGQQGRSAEILCADSITVFKGFEIGAAKPSPVDQARHPHHLLNLVFPTQEFTAGDFVRESLRVLEQIYQRGGVPIVVGGTGFYLRALLYGMASNEEEDSLKSAIIKKRLEERAKTEGWPKIYEELIRLDPNSALVVHPNDHYRILRAMQAMELYQRPWSELNQQARRAECRFPGARYFCVKIERESLRARVEARTKQMLQAGLLKEVEGLIESGVPPSTKPMQSVGYKECLELLAGKISLPELEPKIIQATMKLAKQQTTWFRGERGVEWLNPPYFDSLLNALSLA